MSSQSIAFFFLNDFPSGGAEYICANIASTLQARGHRVTIFCRKFHKDQLHPSLPLNYEVVQHHRAKDELAILPQVVEACQERNIEVCFFPVFLWAGAAQLRAATGCKIVYANHSVPFWEVIARKAYRKARAKRNPLYALRWVISDYWRIHHAHCYEKKFTKHYLRRLREVDAYTVLCQGYREQLIQQLNLPTALAQKISVLHNGTQAVAPLATPKEKIILFVGRLEFADKRPDRLLSIWQRTQNALPDWQLVFVGDGNYREKLEQLTQKLQLQRVSFKGFQTHVETFMNKAAILCLTSNFEGWPLVISEAQVRGVVTMGFDVCEGMREQMLPQWKNGVLIPPFDLDAYAAALVKLAQDDKLRQKMSQNVLQHAQQYTLDAAADEYEQLIEQLLRTDTNAR